MKLSRSLYFVVFILIFAQVGISYSPALAQDEDELMFDDVADDASVDEMAIDEEAEIEAEIEAEEFMQEPQPPVVEAEPVPSEPAESMEPLLAEPESELAPDPQLAEPEPAPEPESTPDTQLAEPEPEPVPQPEPQPESEEFFAPTPEELPSEMLATQPLPDEPDLQYEARLHDIFVNFNNAKMPEEEWSALVGARASERYKIQHGDTLWDISKTLFGDGHYWPKVWSINADIKNPHLISPNNSIRFLLGDESEPPAFTVTENATEEGGEKAAAGSEGEPEIPPPTKVSRPVVKKLPPSLPVWQDVASQDNYDDLGIDYARRKILDIEDTIFLPGYVSEQLPESVGRVSEIEVGHNIASAYQYIYVSLDKGVGEVGQSYLVVANRGPIESVHPSIRGFLGYSIDVQGEIQLVERVPGRYESQKGEMFRALVLKIVNPVSVGSILTKGQIEKVRVSEEGTRSQVVAQIIGGTFFNRRQVYGNESFAFLNRGEEDGLAVGHVLPIRANRRVRNEKTEVQSNVRPIGWMRIVKTTPRFATAVVVRAWSDVLTGDLTGSGELLPQMGTTTGSRLDEGDTMVDLQEEFETEE